MGQARAQGGTVCRRRARWLSGSRLQRWRATGTWQLTGAGEGHRANEADSAHARPAARPRTYSEPREHRAMATPENSECPHQEDEAQRPKARPRVC